MVKNSCKTIYKAILHDHDTWSLSLSQIWLESKQ